MKELDYDKIYKLYLQHEGYAIHMKDGKVFGFEELVVVREDYVPRTFKEIKEEIDRKNYNPEDILEITAP